MRSLYNAVKAQVSLRPQRATSNGTVNGLGVDTAGYNSAMLVLELGALGGTSPTLDFDLKIQESDDNSTFTDVAGLTISDLSAGNQSKVLRIDSLDNIKRYIRAVATITLGGTSPTIDFGAVILLGRAFQEPANV